MSTPVNFNNPLSEADLLAAIEPQAFHIAITGHLAVERIIEVCITESVPNPAALDLERSAFAQKLSLAVALGILEESSTSAYKALNTLRNMVAHDLVLTLDKQIVVDLRNCLSPAQRRCLSASPPVDSVQALREVIVGLYSELRAALERRRERQLRAQAYNDMTREMLGTANYGQAWAESRRSLEAELRKRVDGKKVERGWTYVSPEQEHGPWDLDEFEFIAPQ
ncbi:MAG: hypothetical protein P0120_19095 [Nitrospira sp.]|nr:hypothetical protein [Nitrospira sp.]